MTSLWLAPPTGPMAAQAETVAAAILRIATDDHMLGAVRYPQAMAAFADDPVAVCSFTTAALQQKYSSNTASRSRP